MRAGETGEESRCSWVGPWKVLDLLKSGREGLQSECWPAFSENRLAWFEDTARLDRIDGRVSGGGRGGSSSTALKRSAYECAVFDRERGFFRFSRLLLSLCLVNWSAFAMSIERTDNKPSRPVSFQLHEYIATSVIIAQFSVEKGS